MQNKLLPCPFCGGEPRYRIYDLKGYKGCHEYVIRCDDCNIQFKETDVYERPFVAEQKMIGRWNTRKSMERIVEQLEKQALETLGVTKEQFQIDKNEYEGYCSLSLYEVKSAIRNGEKE